MNVDNITSEFKKYIVPLYTDITYLQYIKNVLVESIGNQEFLSQFQGEKFSMLPTYFLLLHNSLILEICKILDRGEQKDDYHLKKFLEQFPEKICCNDKKIIEKIHNKYKNVRNKKLAHFTTVSFIEKDYLCVKRNDIFSFEELDDDIVKIGNIIQKCANLLNVKVEIIQEQQKSKYTNFPEITPDFIREKKLFVPLF